MIECLLTQLLIESLFIKFFEAYDKEMEIT